MGSISLSIPAGLLYVVSHRKEQCEDRKNNEKCKIESRKQQNIVQRLALILLGIFPESNQAGQRGDQRAHAADVHAQ